MEHHQEINDILFEQARNRRNARNNNNLRRRPRLRVRNRVPFQQQYLYIWQLAPERSQWLRQGDTPYEARCILCNRTMVAKLTVINNHARSRRHQNNENHDDNNNQVEMENEEQFKEEVARIKIMLSLFFVKHKLPFRLIDELLPLIQNISDNKNALWAVKLKRLTMAKIVKHCIAVEHKRQLIAALQTQKFSILFDESTDISCDKHGVIIVRYYNEQLQKIICSTYEIVNIYIDDDEHSDATAASLYSRIMEAFDNFDNIPRTNLVAFCSDGCNTMIGVHNSVAQRFSQDFPHITTIVCPAHAAHLCASTAFRVFPQNIQDFARDVYNCISKSPKRRHALLQQQINLNLDVHKILRHVPVRWLSLGPAIDRILEQWDAILATFNNVENPPLNIQNVIITMQNPVTKCYILFLNFILPILENLNGFIQSDEVILPKVYSRICEGIKDLSYCFLNVEYVNTTDSQEIDVLDEDFHLHLLNIDVGDRARELANLLPEEEKITFFKNCLNYLTSATHQMQIRLEEVWRRFERLNCFIPSNALSEHFHDVYEDIIAEHYESFTHAAVAENGLNIPLENLQTEWNNLITYNINDVINNNDNNIAVDKFWSILMTLQDEQENLLFQNLSRFVLNILVIPHGNAAPERAFSEEKLIKTYLRNRLSTKSLNTLMQVSSLLRASGCNDDILVVQLSQELIDSVVHRNYNHLERDDEENENDSENDDIAGEGLYRFLLR